jgi:ATP-dependent Zn protease
MNNYRTLIDLLSNWFPMLLLVGVWIFFLRQMRGQIRGPNSPQERSIAELKRHNEALEKILVSIDARLQKIEGKGG